MTGCHCASSHSKNGWIVLTLGSNDLYASIAVRTVQVLVARAWAHGQHPELFREDLGVQARESPKELIGTLFEGGLRLRAPEIYVDLRQSNAIGKNRKIARPWLSIKSANHRSWLESPKIRRTRSVNSTTPIWSTGQRRKTAARGYTLAGLPVLASASNLSSNSKPDVRGL